MPIKPIWLRKRDRQTERKKAREREGERQKEKKQDGLLLPEFKSQYH